MRFQDVATTLVGLLPRWKIKTRLLSLLGHQLHESARIGPSLIHRSILEMDRNARIGWGNVIRNISPFRLGEDAAVGQFNWFSSAHELSALLSSAGIFSLGDGAALTNRHYVDCSGGVTIGRMSTVAGVRSTLITHGINFERNEQSIAAIRIGDYCLISSNCSIVPGVDVPDRVVVGMGAVIAGGGLKEGMLHVGVPAKPIRVVDRGQYFSRAEGKVRPPVPRSHRAEE